MSNANILANLVSKNLLTPNNTDNRLGIVTADLVVHCLLQALLLLISFLLLMEQKLAVQVVLVLLYLVKDQERIYFMSIKLLVSMKPLPLMFQTHLLLHTL